MIDWRIHLTRNPAVASNQLCATGTRIPVTVILANLSEGLSRGDILRQYPSLTAEHVDASLAYAADLVEEEAMLPLSGL